jgi:hypothetical protein
MTVVDMFQHPTIQGLAEFVTGDSQEARRPASFGTGRKTKRGVEKTEEAPTGFGLHPMSSSQNNMDGIAVMATAVAFPGPDRG